jgi:eukaryotic-like serine/threonine-protein kinase
VTATPTPQSTDDLARFAAALAGQYDVEREIGRGGMGIVYLARDPRLDRHVAIKTLPPHLAFDPVVRERFLREARTAGRLSHQNIVPIHRADEALGRVFFVMGYVDGDSVAQQVRDRGRLEPNDVVRQLRDVAGALGYAHAHGVIHRDVKAENILLDRASGRAMVTDFGIARLAEAAPLTATGQVLGTVYYLSPEQISGDPVDARSDIYSLGVVGYFALSGRFPFDAELASAVLIAHVTKTPPPVHTVAASTPRALADIVDRCLAKDPAARFQNCDELIDALDRLGNLTALQTVERDGAAAPPRPGLISDSEAQSILGRAADLQASTGLVPRPSPLAMRRDSQRDAALTSGYRPADLRDAAVEAGISARYVDHVFEERGLAPSAPLEVRPPVLVDRSRPENLLAGGHTHIEYEVIVNGEMPERDYDLLADIIRQSTAEAGQISAVGRSFTWQPHQFKRNLQVSVLARGGKTTIRVSETLRQTAGALFGGIVGGFGGGTSGIWIGIGANLHNLMFGVWMWAGSVAASYLAARGLFGRASRKREEQIRTLAERLATQARESIAAAQPLTLPRSP